MTEVKAQCGVYGFSKKKRGTCAISGVELYSFFLPLVPIPPSQFCWLALLSTFQAKPSQALQHPIPLFFRYVFKQKILDSSLDLRSLCPSHRARQIRHFSRSRQSRQYGRRFDRRGCYDQPARWQVGLQLWVEVSDAEVLLFQIHLPEH